LAVRTTTNVDDDTQDDETDDCSDFDDGEDEFGFTVSFDTVVC
jgi:hypothetical protein